jgi:hypothetical protein
MMMLRGTVVSELDLHDTALNMAWCLERVIGSENSQDPPELSVRIRSATGSHHDSCCAEGSYHG